MNQNQPEWQNNTGPNSKCDAHRPIWRSVLLLGNIELLAAMLKDGFTPDSPVSNLGRHPLIDLCLEKPASDAHAKALAETARVLINAGAALNLPDYKGLIPADYALASPNPFIARQIILGTLRNKIDKNLQYSYRPQIDVLFSTAMCKPERQKLHDHITRNLAVLREALNPDALSGDPLLAIQDHDDIFFWRNLTLKSPDRYPTETMAMRNQFRRLANMTTSGEGEGEGEADDEALSKRIVSAEEMEQEQDKYRMLEFAHARRFQI